MHFLNIKKEIDSIEYDITNAPGVVGYMTKAINAASYRLQPRLAILSALQCVSIAASNNAMTPTGSKLNLITMGISPTGSGKDKGIEYLVEVCNVLGINISGRIPSAPSVGKTLIENNGMAFYVIDEAHTLFDSIYSSRAPSYKQELDSELLSCYTSKRKLFSIVDVKGIKEDCDKEEKRIKNNVNDESIGKPEGDKLLKLIEARKDLVSKGVENPFFGMCTYSTPSNMEKVFRAETIESGLIGRTIFVRGSDDCPPMNFDMTTELVVDSKVVSKLSNIKQFCRGRVQFIDADAAQYAVHVGKVIDKYRNEPQVGEIIRRLWELSMKVASILAIGDTGKITRLHITWAVYMLLESLTDTWATFRVNDSQGDDGMVARWSELVARITKIVGTTSQKEPMLASVIKARVFKTKGNRILKLCEAAYAADVEYGKGEFVRMALTEMLTAGVLDKDGNKWWIFHPENQASIKVSAEFANIYNNVGRFSAFMR